LHSADEVVEGDAVLLFKGAVWQGSQGFGSCSS
jgi:hypothetical protein